MQTKTWHQKRLWFMIYGYLLRLTLWFCCYSMCKQLSETTEDRVSVYSVWRAWLQNWAIQYRLGNGKNGHMYKILYTGSCFNNSMIVCSQIIIVHLGCPYMVLYYESHWQDLFWNIEVKLLDWEWHLLLYTVQWTRS